MTTKRSLVAILLILPILAGCSAYQPPKTYTVETSRLAPASFDATWQAALDYFAVNEIPTKELDKESGLIVTELTLTDETSDFADCGAWGTNVTVALPTGSVRLTVRAIDASSTSVTIDCEYRTTKFSKKLSRYEPAETEIISCSATGRMERQIHDFIAEQVAR